MIPHIERVRHANMRVYGADKVWKQLRREGSDVAGYTVERLIRQCGLGGALRGKGVRMTIGDKTASRPLDQVNRQLQAQRPNQLWVSDFTDAAQSGAVLDVAIDYVLTLRMRPIKVKLRLLAGAERGTSYVLVQRAP